MKLYTVYSKSGDDEWQELRTLDKKEAIEYARDAKARNQDPHYYYELRVNELPDGANYKEFDNEDSEFYDKKAKEDFYVGCDFIYFDLDDRLKEYREEYNLTVPKLAKYLKVPQRTLENWLSGKVIPNDITAYAVIDKLSSPYYG